ncbi:hypothetical protein K437DRAFT_255852 [Tilletiaria anomala UBC 951]|uniref:Uncharacterized protein n=1 Tax=Tilletiaria anomala (strain ATCC 24038 / CBS 436.72 / UBC 951) TaxID=1037660 RepID=A0A066W450_TILAU|nr:uncharacterized protein K437DRAFT_255852 [Tilletiaria anomala UBC 951]KDN47313.1 hypothetical protein K437DRAFT_255852 [Tilletiaria anomala UBC 951]
MATLRSTKSNIGASRSDDGAGCAGKRRTGRIDPTLMMSSRTEAFAKAGLTSRRSCDRLSRTGSSGSLAVTTATSSKGYGRSKSYTQLAQAAAVERGSSKASAKRRQGSSTALALRASNSRIRLASGVNKDKPEREQDDDGWASATEEGSTNASAASSPVKGSDADDSGDEDALVVGIKKKALPKQKESGSSGGVPLPEASTLRTPRAGPQKSEERDEDVPAHDLRNTQIIDRAPSEQSQDGSERTLAEEPSAFQNAISDGTHSATPEAANLPGLNTDSNIIPEDQQQLAFPSSQSAGNRNISSPVQVSSNDRQPGEDARRASYAETEASPAAASTHSRLSVRARTSSLLPRDSVHIASPKLDKHNALAGTLGSLLEDRPYQGDRLLRRSATEAVSELSRRNSTASLQPVSPMSSSGNRDTDIGSFGDRKRTISSQSLTATDAAKLAAQLRRARDHLSGTGEEDIHSSSSRRGHATSSLGKLPEFRAEKPISSTFAKTRTNEAQQEAFVQPVGSGSIFSEGWTHAKKMGAQTSLQAQSNVKKIRYVLPYGLSGPPIENNSLNSALLSPAFEENEFESSWAPALANAAGLGSRSSRGTHMHGELAADGIPVGDIFDLDGNAMVNGPNATPLHIIHGLTSISNEPFPLEATDLAAGSDIPAGHTMLIKPSTMRAIALTVQAQSVQRQHTVTRRFADPMRNSLERVARASGRLGAVPRSTASSSKATGRWARSPMSQPSTPGIPSCRKSAPNSPTFPDPDFSRNPGTSRVGGPGDGIGGHAQQSYAAQLVDAAEHPVRSLKRVWSGGLARGGLAALTSTAEEPS